MMMEAAEAEEKTKEELETVIAKALRARVKDFREQADSLTYGGVRRALEEDLGLKTKSLDVHKRFIKECLQEVFDAADDEHLHDTSEKIQVEANQTLAEEHENIQPVSSSKSGISSTDDNVGRSNLLDDKKTAEHEIEKAQAFEPSSDLSEGMIKEAIKRRAAYFRENLEKLSMQQVRRTLEEDLSLERKTLDAYKSYVSKELDEVLQEPEDVKPANGVRENLKKGSRKTDAPKKNKVIKRPHEDTGTSDINDSCDEDKEIDKGVTSKKKVTEKGKGSTKKQKRAAEDKKASSSKSKKVSKTDIDRSSKEGGANLSENDHSHSSEEEDNKKKSNPAPVYGKQVEHLKSIIKSCGMSIPPAVYKRVKQAPENKREAYLIKELEGILEKEGLSTKPSEKEIKAVKKKKERAKELEGIDMSNIISSSRRRSTSSYIPLPKPQIEVESDDDDDDEEEDKEEEVEDDEGNGKDGVECDNDGRNASEGSGEDAEGEAVDDQLLEVKSTQ